MPTPPVSKVAELYGYPTHQNADWPTIVAEESCPFLHRRCLKNRKSEAELTIGTCTMSYGKSANEIMICPFRLLERSQIFMDCIHLLGLHEPGNELRLVPELPVPGGSIDYCLVSVRDGKPRDFVGIELQTLDTTGTVWPERQRFIRQHGVPINEEHAASRKPFGMNWKMTAKTILVQLNHKVATFEHLNKRFVLVLQNHLLAYMRREFSFGHIAGQRNGDPMQFHAYELRRDEAAYTLHLAERVSTDSAGIATSLGLQADSKVDLDQMLQMIESRLAQSTLLTVGGRTVPVPESVSIAANEDA